MLEIKHACDNKCNTNVIAARQIITDVKTLADRVRDAREQKGWTQQQLADRAGVSQATIGNIEAGTRSHPRSLLKIAAALGRRPEWLQTGRGQELEDQSPSSVSEPVAPYEPTISVALAGLEPYIKRVNYGARKATGSLIATWVEDPDKHRDIIKTIERLLQPNQQTPMARGRTKAKKNEP